MNFNEIFKSFKVFVVQRQKKQSWETLLNNFESHILPYFKDKDIFELTASDIINWQNIILSKHYSNSYNNNLYVDFNTFMKFCCNYYNLPVNLVKQVGNFPKHIEEKHFDFYNLKEFNQFIKCVDNIVYKQFFNFMFYTGTRPSEAMALKFSDLSDNIISINKILTTKGGRTFDSPKNKSSIRTFVIDNKLKKDLIKLKKYYINLYQDSSFDYFIFGGIKYLSPSTINRRKLEACVRAKIRPITLHQFRHSHASLLVHNGIDITAISKRLGHSNCSTTMSVYIHPDRQEKRVLKTLNSLRFTFFK